MVFSCSFIQLSDITVEVSEKLLDLYSLSNHVIKWVVGDVWSMCRKKPHHGTMTPSLYWCIVHCQASIPSPQGQGQQNGT